MWNWFSRQNITVTVNRAKAITDEHSIDTFGSRQVLTSNNLKGNCVLESHRIGFFPSPCMYFMRVQSASSYDITCILLSASSYDITCILLCASSYDITCILYIVKCQLLQHYMYNVKCQLLRHYMYVVMLSPWSSAWLSSCGVSLVRPTTRRTSVSRHQRKLTWSRVFHNSGSIELMPAKVILCARRNSVKETRHASIAIR